MIEFGLLLMLCLFAYLGLFSLEHNRVDNSLSKY
jgi:hypothetical protein